MPATAGTTGWKKALERIIAGEHHEQVIKWKLSGQSMQKSALGQQSDQWEPVMRDRETGGRNP